MLAGASATPIQAFAQRIVEGDLARFPPAEAAHASEHNAALIEAECATPPWREALARAAAATGVDAHRLEILCRQRFILAHGRRLTQLRELLAIEVSAPLELASDLPPETLARLMVEGRWGGSRIRILPAWSAALRAVACATGALRLVALHAAAAVRILRLAALPARDRVAPGTPDHVAWLGANAPEMAALGPAAFSLPEFLAESVDPPATREVLILGAAPKTPLPPGLRHMRGRIAPRWRPRMRTLLRQLLSQAAHLLRDLARARDWRHRDLIAPSVLALPGLRAWFETDAPRALLYPNSEIGNESAAALVSGEYGVATMMVFYSANVAHLVPPRAAARTSDIEPEIRCIIADRIAMWSTDMRAAFSAAGYPPERLPVTGLVHYGRQSVFAPTSRFSGARRKGPVRIGLFEVTTTQAARRFLVGYGQTLYHPEYCRRFFAEVLAAADNRFGDGYVVVRKLKRQPNLALHAAPPDLVDRLPAGRLVSPPPETSLWSVLSEVDLVICMPFTSVAYMADHYGIPAAYFDPDGGLERSSLCGRAPLLKARAQLETWLREPGPIAGYDASMLVARETLRAARGDAWREPRLAPGN